MYIINILIKFNLILFNILTNLVPIPKNSNINIYTYVVSCRVITVQNIDINIAIASTLISIFYFIVLF